MGQRKAVTRAIATRYRRAGKADKGKILDELCATTGWHRSHARKALAAAGRPALVPAPRRPRTPTYGPDALVALRFCWAVLGTPTGKRLAPATMDRRLAPARAAMALRGRSHTKPGSLLKSQIPIRTWAQWDDAVPGSWRSTLVGHEGGNAEGEHCYTLTVTDIATGWTENRTVRNKAQKWVVAALEDIAQIMPFPLLGVDSAASSSTITCWGGATSAR
jgi:hypothetical protein